MLGRKKKPKEPDYTKKPVLPNTLAMFVQAKYGISPDELHKLFASMGRVDETIKIARRQGVKGKEYSRRIGKVLAILDAAEFEKERAEKRHVKEGKINELIDDEEFLELRVPLEVNDSVYPKRLSPLDVVHCIDAAGERLEELDRERAKPLKIYSAREEAVLDVITFIKKEEPVRVARMIAARQLAYIFSKPMEELEFEYSEWLRNLKGLPPPETEEEMMARLAAEEEQLLEEERLAAEEAARNFDDLPTVYTLLDEIAELIRNNPEAAAAIIRQWIGNAMLAEPAN